MSKGKSWKLHPEILYTYITAELFHSLALSLSLSLSLSLNSVKPHVIPEHHIPQEQHEGHVHGWTRHTTETEQADHTPHLNTLVLRLFFFSIAQ